MRNGSAPSATACGNAASGSFVRKIPFAGKKANVGAAFLRLLIADRSAQCRITRLERLEQCALRDLTVEVDCNFAVDACQGAQVRREDDADHANVWTSTESTAGKSCTIAFQLSPASAETYTWPPVVPK